MIPGGTQCSSCGGGHLSSWLQLHVTRKRNQNCKAFCSGLGTFFLTMSCVYFAGSLMLGHIQHQLLSTQCSFCIPLTDWILLEWKLHLGPHRCSLLVLLVNESVCGFRACPSTALLSYTIVKNTWLASDHIIYSKKIDWASWSILADYIWSWYAHYNFAVCTN